MPSLSMPSCSKLALQLGLSISQICLEQYLTPNHKSIYLFLNLEKLLSGYNHRQKVDLQTLKKYKLKNCAGFNALLEYDNDVIVV